MSFFEIFQPTARHQREERDRQNTLVTRPAVGAGGPLGIDLESGKATIPMPQRPEPEEQTELEAQAEGEDTGAAEEPAEDRPTRHPDLDG